MIEGLANWIAEHGAQVALALPLVTLAGSALAYIVKLFLDLSDRRRKHFLELVQLLDEKGTLAGKLAAVYQLSQYRRHRAFLVRFFENREKIVDGTTGDVLKEEMRIAAEHLRG